MRAKSKAWTQVVVDAEHEHVAVVGLDLAGLEDQQAVLVLEGAVVALGVELAVLGEHDAVERQLLAPDPLAVVVDLGPAVVGAHRVGVEVEDHAGRNRGTAKASPSSRSAVAKSATTGWPMRDLGRVARRRCWSAPAAPRPARRRPARTGRCSLNGGTMFWWVTVNVCTVPRPDADEVLDRVGEALRAQRPRLVLHDPARRAALQHELAAPGALPPARASPTTRTAADAVMSLIGSSPQDQGGAAVGDARACRRCRARRPARAPSHLAGAALAAQLLGRLDDEEDAAHARVVRRQAAAVEVHRQRAAEADAAVADERAALADLAEARGSPAWPAR